jgi:hypothetical protein
VTLSANADFATLLFDVDELFDDKGETASSVMARGQMIGLALCIADGEGGEVWIDHIMLGSDPLHADEPETPVTPDEPADPTVEPQGGNTTLIVVIALGVIAIAVAVVVVVVMKKKKV